MNPIVKAINKNFINALEFYNKSIYVGSFDAATNPTINRIIENDSDNLISRIEYWIRQRDLNAKIVCSNVEFGRFAIPINFIDSIRCVKPMIVKCDLSKVEAMAVLIDNWSNDKSIAMPQLESIQEDGDCVETKYISVLELIQCLSSNAVDGDLKTYCTTIINAFYQLQSECCAYEAYEIGIQRRINDERDLQLKSHIDRHMINRGDLRLRRAESYIAAYTLNNRIERLNIKQMDMLTINAHN